MVKVFEVINIMFVEIIEELLEEGCSFNVDMFEVDYLLKVLDE